MPSAGEIVHLLTHPDELRAIINYKVWRDPTRDITDPKEHDTSGWDRESMRECWGLLDLTSRSFAMVIKELEGDLARVVCIFYLVLRALDTIEDDMTIPNSVKLPNLRTLHLKLHGPAWSFHDSKEKDRAVLEKFPLIQEEFARLDEKYQAVIADICRKMGAGMADFAALATPEHPVAEVDTIADYDLYCHYVAGLVGEGLSGLFASSGFERPWLADQLTLSNSMGLLLQKTNITRDVHEDVVDGRGFWPRAIWSKYGFESMNGLIDPAREKEALWASSEMILDALRHATDSLDYLTLIRSQSVFNFVSIPAVMAMATLDRCFMNPDMLKKNVKIRKGEALSLIHKSVNPRDVAYIFRGYATSIHSKVKPDDPNLLKLSIACAKIVQWTEHHYPSFLEIQGQPGSVHTAINPRSTDARAQLFLTIAKKEQEKADAARQALMLENLKARGVLKDLTPEEQAARLRQRQIEAEQGAPVVWILAVVVGVLAFMVALGGGIVWVIMNYFDDTA